MSVRIGLGQRIPSKKINDRSYMQQHFARRAPEVNTSTASLPTMTHAELKAHRAAEEAAKVPEVVVTMAPVVKVKKARAKATAVPAAKKPTKSKK